MNWQLDAQPAPALLVLPPDAASLDEAHAAIEMWEYYSRKTLDPTQRLVVEVLMAETADGKWAAKTTGREMPRQNGKGDEIEVVELWGLVQRDEAIMHTIHDAVLLATQTQERMLAKLQHPDLRPKVKRKWMGVGQQMIEMRNGGIIWYRTRSGGGGRGVDDIDRLVVDEAQHATTEQMSAVTSTLMANDNPQMNAMGTSALAGRSDWWWGFRRRALIDNPGPFGYVGHTAENVYLDDKGEIVQEPVDVQDRKLWYIANPSLAAGRGEGIASFEEELHRLGEEAFAQEHLGVWDPPPRTEATESKLPAEAWADTATDEPPDVAAGEITIGWEVARDGTWASIAIGFGDIRSPYVELIEHRQGTGWLPARLVHLVNKWQPIAVGCINAGGSAAQVGPVLSAFREAGIADDMLTLMPMTQYRAGCGGLYSDVIEGRLSRLRGQGPLDAAAKTAVERAYGTDSWVFEGRSASTPIGPLVAVTVARALLPTEVEGDGARAESDFIVI